MILAFALGIATASSPLADAVILVIRHAEKPEVGNGLTPLGEQRANAYVSYFKAYRVEGEPLKLDWVFAASDSKKSIRPRLTVEPLAQSVHLKPDLDFTDKDPQALAAELRTKPHGHEILVCWRHGEIPALVSSLGGDAKALVPEVKWPDNVFDRVIEMHFDKRGSYDAKHSRMVKEHLLPGDEK